MYLQVIWAADWEHKWRIGFLSGLHASWHKQTIHTVLFAVQRSITTWQPINQFEGFTDTFVLCVKSRWMNNITQWCQQKGLTIKFLQSICYHTMCMIFMNHWSTTTLVYSSINYQDFQLIMMWYTEYILQFRISQGGLLFKHRCIEQPWEKSWALPWDSRQRREERRAAWRELWCLK